MEVIEDNFTINGWGPGFTCGGCKSVLKLSEADVEIGFFGANYGGDRPEREYCYTCVLCGKDNIISSHIPAYIKKVVDQRVGK